MLAGERRRREGYDVRVPERGWTIACVAYPWLGTEAQLYPRFLAPMTFFLGLGDGDSEETEVSDG